MKKAITLILALCLLLCPLGVSAAEPELQTAYGYAKLLNFGEFPEKPEYEAGIATASIPQYNSAAGATDSTSKSDSQEIHEYLRNCMINCEQKISIESYKISVAETNKIFTETTNYYPELFHINNEYGYSYSTSGTVITLSPQYVNPEKRSEIYSNQASAKAAYDTALKTYNDEIEHIISGIAPEMTDLEKALYVHDYIVTHFKYDLRGCSNNKEINKLAYHDAYSFFKTDEGVCQAYTQAFNGIMHRLGIECTSALDDKDNHTWNIITLDGNNYHIDTTQDDPLGYSSGSAKHTYFLLSDETIRTIDDILYRDPDNTEKDVNSHEDWYTAMYKTSCDEKKYESGYAWNDADSSFEFVDGYWYYIKYSGSSKSKLYRTKNFSYSEPAIENDFDTKFPVPDKPGYGYDGYFGGITAVGNLVYYSAPNLTVYCYSTKTGDVSIITVSPPSSINTVTSCRYEGNGILKVFFSSVPNSYDDGGSTTVTLFKIGDTNGDGNVNGTDITTIKKHLLGAETNFNWATVDFGNKKQVNILDLVKIKKLASTAN